MSGKQTAIIEETTKGTVRPHQPGESAFKAILTEDIDWKPFPAFPPSVRLAVVVGQPSEPGPYMVRVRVPRGVKLMPHKHPEDRIYTVMSGVFYIGLGDEFDALGETRIRQPALATNSLHLTARLELATNCAVRRRASRGIPTRCRSLSEPSRPRSAVSSSHRRRVSWYCSAPPVIF
jgi:hypothetical protein